MITRTLITAFILISALAPVSAFATGTGVVGCQAGGAIGGGLASVTAAASVLVPVNDIPGNVLRAQIVAKECVLDGLVVAVREAMIASITQSIVNWINSGFEGGPTFVTDLNAFLREVADNVALDFIEGTELGFFCSPFQQNIRIALATRYGAERNFKERASCTLGEYADNIDRMFAGDWVGGGGWPAWFRIHLEPQNNPVGAFIIASAELNRRIEEAQKEQIKLLEFGDGFFSKRECVQYETRRDSEEDSSLAYGGMDAPKCLKWNIITPGTQINAQLAKTLGLPLDQLALADEIDEIISALLAQLAQQVLTSINGLVGLSSRSSSSSFDGASYLERLVDETRDGSLTRGKDALIADINGSIQTEEQYQEILQGIIIGYEGAESGFQNLFLCAETAGLSGQAAQASTTIAIGIRPILTDYRNQKAQSEETVRALTLILAEVVEAQNEEELTASAVAYESIVTSGVIRTIADISLLLNESQAQQLTFGEYDETIANGLRRCGG